MSGRETTQKWWQTISGILTATAGMVTAIAGLIAVLIQAGVFDRDNNRLPVTDTRQIGAISSPSSVLELESKLKAVNIKLSTGTEDDVARVRSYFTGPTSAYHLLAINCIEVLGNRQLRKTGYLDMIDKWYTTLVGAEHYVTSSGGLDLKKLKEAIIRANNEYYGQDVTSFEQIVEPKQ